MAKAIKKKKSTPKRPKKYEDKLKLNGTFDQLVAELITPKVPLKKK